jgi:hypothetical protein
MTNLQRIKLHNPTRKPRSESNQLRQRIVIGSLSGLIALVMIVWFGILGWGAIEGLKWLAAWLKDCWAV